MAPCACRQVALVILAACSKLSADHQLVILCREDRDNDLTIVSSSCNLSDVPQRYTFAATGSFFIVLQVLQFIIPEFFNYFYLNSSYLLDSCLHQVF